MKVNIYLQYTKNNSPCQVFFCFLKKIEFQSPASQCQILSSHLFVSLLIVGSANHDLAEEIAACAMIIIKTTFKENHLNDGEES